MHAHYAKIDVQAIIDAGPLSFEQTAYRAMWALLTLGVVVFFAALFSGYPADVLWASYYASALFWMGLGIGGVMTTVIYQIVRAKWSPPVRRIGEANISFVPWAMTLVICSYFGKEYLFPWATSPMPGREEYMEPNFVYGRFIVIFGLFYIALRKYVSLSLRGDVCVAREECKDKELWHGGLYARIAQGWKGKDSEVPALQRTLSRMAPALVLFYVVLYTLFGTEMIVGMDAIWFSNMFGGFQFLGNLYMGWATTALIALYLARRSRVFNQSIQTRQFWDLGMLCLGFSMLWGYTFFAQFLPQWYSNMPEETQWLIVRSRDYPWKTLGWLTFSLCFVIPFVCLLSEDVKKSPRALTAVCLIALAGIWLEKYVLVMPQISPLAIPFSMIDVCIFLGFLGLYGICMMGFLRKYPMLPVSHPLTSGSREW